MLVTLPVVRHRRIATALGATALAVGALAVAPVAPPVEVERVEPTRPGLVISPAVIDADPDDEGWLVVEHRLVNGTSNELSLTLEVRPVDETTGQPDGNGELDVEVGLTAGELELAPSEAARIASLAQGVGAGVAYAVVAEVVGADPPARVSSVVLATTGPAEVSIGTLDLTAEHLHLALDATSGPTLVDAAVRLRTWYGHTVLETSHPDLIAWDGERPVELQYDLEGIHVPGPYYIEVVASGGTGETRTAVTRWLLPEAAVYAAAALAVALSLLAVTVVAVRWRRRKPVDEP